MWLKVLVNTGLFKKGCWKKLFVFIFRHITDKREGALIHDQ